MENEINFASHYSFYTRPLFNKIKREISFCLGGLWGTAVTENETFGDYLEMAQELIFLLLNNCD